MATNVNSFLAIATSGMSSIATRGLAVASAVAVAIVWNDDIGPTRGQPREPRNALLGRLQRNLADKGMKVSSVDTWRKHGQRFALNYSAEIEHVVTSLLNGSSDGTNREPTAAEMVSAVVQWAKARFPTLQEFNDDVSGRVSRTDDEKALTAARKLLTMVTKSKAATLLADIARIAEARCVLLGSHGDISAGARAEAETIIKAVLENYKPETEQRADTEITTEEADSNVIALAA